MNGIKPEHPQLRTQSFFKTLLVWILTAFFTASALWFLLNPSLTRRGENTADAVILDLPSVKTEDIQQMPQQGQPEANPIIPPLPDIKAPNQLPTGDPSTGMQLSKDGAANLIRPHVPAPQILRPDPLKRLND